MQSKQNINYEMIETHLEKVRYFFTRGLHSESVLLLDQLIPYYSNKNYTDKQLFEVVTILKSEKALIYILLEKYQKANEILIEYLDNRENREEIGDVAFIAINQAWSYYQILINNLDLGLKAASDVLDVLEASNSDLSPIDGLFRKERTAFTEYLISYGYWLKGNLHIANEFGISSLKKFKENHTMRIIQSLNLQSTINRALGQLELSIDHINEAITFALSFFNQHIQPLLLNNLGLTYIEAGFYKKAERVFRKGLVASDDTFDFKTKSIILTNLAELQFIRGAITESEELFREILKLVRHSPSLKQTEAIAVMNLGKISLQVRKYPQAARHFESSLQLMETLNYQKEMPELLAYYARTLAILKNFETSEELISKAKTLAGSLGQDSILPLIYLSEGIYYRLSSGLKDKKTLESFEGAYNKAKDHGNHLRTLEGAMYLAEIYLSGEEPNFDSAKYYLSEAITLATEGDIVPLIVRGLLLSATIHATELNFGLALYDLQQAEEAALDVHLQEELFDIENLRERIKQQIPYLQWVSEGDVTRDPSLMLSLIIRITKRIPEEIKLDSTSLLMYHFTSEGPEILYSVNSRELNPVAISSLGVVLSIVIGQGQSLFKGLYGPIPIQNTNSLAICYTTFLKDENQSDKRLHGQNFIIFAFIYPKEVERLILYDKRKLTDTFARYCSENPDVVLWNNERLETLKKETVNAFLN
jgi:tetratricopeptide (TPR) repeat protein